MITKTYNNTKLRNWMQFRDDLRAGSFSLSQAMLLDTSYTEADVLKVLRDNSKYGAENQHSVYFNPDADGAVVYVTTGGLEVSWRWDGPILTAWIYHPRGWYPESTLLANMWDLGWYFDGKPPFEYDNNKASSVKQQERINHVLRQATNEELEAKLDQRKSIEPLHQEDGETNDHDEALLDALNTLEKLRESRLNFDN